MLMEGWCWWNCLGWSFIFLICQGLERQNSTTRLWFPWWHVHIFRMRLEQLCARASCSMEMHLRFEMVQICRAGNFQFCHQEGKHGRKSDTFAIRAKCLLPSAPISVHKTCSGLYLLLGILLLLQDLLQIRVINEEPHSLLRPSWRAGMNIIKAWEWRGIKEMGNHWAEPQCQAAVSSKPAFRAI